MVGRGNLKAVVTFEVVGTNLYVTSTVGEDLFCKSTVVVTTVDGARTKQVAIGQDVACTRRMLRTYVEAHLSADGWSDADVKVFAQTLIG